MAIDHEIDGHTYFFWEFCKVVSWIAIVAFVVGIIMLLFAQSSNNAREQTAIALATMLAAVQTWFVCRFAIVVIKILDTLGSRNLSVEESPVFVDQEKNG